MRRGSSGSRGASSKGTETEAAGAAGVASGLAAQRASAQSIFNAPPADGDLLKLDPDEIAPCPLNIRLDYGNLEELRESISRLGVLENGVVAERERFVKAYPDCDEKTLQRPYVAIFGHRRREAAAGLDGVKLPMVLRNDIVDRSLVEEVMAGENKERQDLSPVEEALAIRQYQERHSVSAEEAGQRLYNYAKGTTSKRMRLLNLHPDLQQAVHRRELGATDAYTLAKAFARDEAAQLEAWRLVNTENLTADAAVSRLTRLASQQPSEAASREAIPGGEVPGQRDAEATTEPAQPAAAEPAGAEPPPQVSGGNPTAATASARGVPSPVATPKVTDEVRPPSTAPDPAVEAAKLRDAACRAVCKLDRPAPAEQVTRRLAIAVLAQGGARSAALQKAHSWLEGTGHAPAGQNIMSYIEDVLERGDDNLVLRVAFAVALAEAEIRAAHPSRDWDQRDAAHLDLLITRGGHAPTKWERKRLDEVSAGNLVH